MGTCVNVCGVMHPSLCLQNLFPYIIKANFWVPATRRAAHQASPHFILTTQRGLCSIIPFSRWFAYMWMSVCTQNVLVWTQSFSIYPDANRSSRLSLCTYMHIYVCPCPRVMSLFHNTDHSSSSFCVRCFASITILYVIINPDKANGIIYIGADKL